MGKPWRKLKLSEMNLMKELTRSPMLLTIGEPLCGSVKGDSTATALSFLLLPDVQSIPFVPGSHRASIKHFILAYVCRIDLDGVTHQPNTEQSRQQDAASLYTSDSPGEVPEDDKYTHDVHKNRPIPASPFTGLLTPTGQPPTSD